MTIPWTHEDEEWPLLLALAWSLVPDRGFVADFAASEWPLQPGALAEPEPGKSELANEWLVIFLGSQMAKDGCFQDSDFPAPTASQTYRGRFQSLLGEYERQRLAVERDVPAPRDELLCQLLDMNFRKMAGFIAHGKLAAWCTDRGKRDRIPPGSGRRLRITRRKRFAIRHFEGEFLLANSVIVGATLAADERELFDVTVLGRELVTCFNGRVSADATHEKPDVKPNGPAMRAIHDVWDELFPEVAPLDPQERNDRIKKKIKSTVRNSVSDKTIRRYMVWRTENGLS